MVDDEHDEPESQAQHEWPRHVQDPVHDSITISAKLCSFIDTPQFQRLRFIKQLGSSYYVWPGASHNRFEHCLGVAHLARRMAQNLQRNQPRLNITDRDVDCVEIAGLCHDLGHGPWSHVWDNTFIPHALVDREWKHEDASEMMFDYLVNDNEIDISDEDCVFIKALIASQPKKCLQEKKFLFEIVSNSRNGIDVDKFDYILRDTRAVGEKGNLSLTRLIESARVIDNEICYDIKVACQIFEVFQTRFNLHKRIYNHKTAKAIEYMIVDALLEAEPHLHIAEQVFQPEKFVYLTEDILSTIERSTDDKLSKARTIINRIRKRDLYKLVDMKIFGWELRQTCKDQITPASIVKAASQFVDVDDQLVSALTEKDVIVDVADITYGMKDKNPLDNVKFYSKHNPNQCRKAEKGEVLHSTPSSFAECLLRVYTRHLKYAVVIQRGYRAVLQDMERRSPSMDLVRDSMLTPPTTDAATTPQTSQNTSYASLGEASRTNGGDFAPSYFMTIQPGSGHAPF